MWRFLEGSRSQHGEITTETSTIRLYIWYMVYDTAPCILYHVCLRTTTSCDRTLYQS